MEPEKKSNGALVGLVIVIIILVVGGIYVWQMKNKGAVNQTGITTDDSASLEALEADLNTADLDVGANAVGSVE